MWAAGDQMARGFIIGATAGRTTLTGEGLQHADGHSPLLASTNPAVVSYDPAYGYEIGHIVRAGLDRMYGGSSTRDPNVMYYLTVYNEPIVQPAEPEGVDVDGIVARHPPVSTAEGDGPAGAAARLGCRRAVGARGAAAARATTGASRPTSGPSPRGPSCAATAWPPTSTTSCNPGRSRAPPYVTEKLPGADGPVRRRVSDFMHAVPDQIRQFVPERLRTLGADDFGFSDTRAAARRFFKIDGPSIVVRTLQALAEEGEVDAQRSRPQAIEKYRLHDVNAGTTGNAGGES